MEEPPQKRFKYASYNERLGEISVDAGKSKGLAWEKEDYGGESEHATPFTAELARRALLDLTIPFQNLRRDITPLTTTLLITLHNLQPISNVFTTFYASLENGKDHLDSGLDSALFLHQALFETCLGEALPLVPSTVEALLRVGALRALDPKIIERTYSTISLILRYIAPTLLKPDLTAQDTLSKTWELFRPYLRPKVNKRYVRKCVADAWIGVIRKARSDGLQRVTDVLLLHSDEEGGMEAVWAGSLKGAPGHLHSRALAILTILLDRLVASPNEHQLHTLSLVATSLVHHCSSSTIVPIIEAILSRIDPVVSPEPSSSSHTGLAYSPSTAMLKVLSVILFTRKGKRFPEVPLKSTMVRLQGLLVHLSQIPEPDNATEHQEWRKALVACIAGCLQAGKLTQWLSPGVALIEGLWNALAIREKFAFADTLISLKWSGVEQFLLPHITKTALPALSEDPLPTLILLNRLASAGYLAGGLMNVQGGRWRQSLVSSLQKLLQHAFDEGQLGLDDRRRLGRILALLPALISDAASFAPLVIGIAKHILDNVSSDPQTDWENSGPWSDSHTLAVLLACLKHLASDSAAAVEVKDFLLSNGVLQRLLRDWHWNREILAVAAGFVDSWQAEYSLEDDDLAALLPNLLSADSLLRSSSLQIFGSSADGATSGEATSTADIWKSCLQIETSEVTLKNVRERTAHIGRLGRILTSLPEGVDERTRTKAIHAISYLVAQLKVNYRPIYGETITALAGVATKFGDDVWRIVWDELERTQAAGQVSMPDLGVRNPEWTKVKRENQQSQRDQQEDEDTSFRCHNLDKGMMAVKQAWEESRDARSLDDKEIATQISQDRLDVLNYETQLLAVLAAAPALAEKHTRLLVPTFFAVARSTSDDDEEIQGSHLSRKQHQARTANFLELLAKFVNPKAAFRSDELHVLYLDILAKGDPKLQGLALRCLMTYKSPRLLPYEDNLTTLLDDAKFRDELAHFSLATDSENIDPQDRNELLPVAIRLLYGIMTSRRGRSSTAQGQSARKQAVLGALSGCSSTELGTLVDLMLEPFVGTTANEVRVAGRQQLGYLILLADVLRYLAPQTVEHWPKLINATIDLVSHAQKQLTQSDIRSNDVDEDADAEEDQEELPDFKGSAPLRTVRTAGIKRLIQFFRSKTSFDFSSYLPKMFHSIISPRLEKLEIENTQAPSGTLDLIAALAASPDTAQSLVRYDKRTLPKTFACMIAIKVKPAVISRVFDILDSLLVQEDEIDLETSVISTVLLPHMKSLLDSIIGLVKILTQSANEEILRRLLSILSRLSAVVTDGEQAQQLALLLGPMLRQSNRQLPEKGKLNVLGTLQRLYTISPDFHDPSSRFFNQSYELISNQFQTLYFPSSRRSLVGVLETFAQADPTLARSVRLVADINAYSLRRMDEPDFDRRLTAFAEINDTDLVSLPTTTREWSPILRSALFFIQEPEELSIRTSASAVLQRFISLVGEAEDGVFVDTLLNAVRPGLRRALRSKLELVRNETLLVISYAVKTCSGIPVLNEMRPLLADEEEANFFSNVSHIQVHRRARALRRLRDICASGDIREASISTIFLPVAEHIIAGSTDVTDHHLVNEAIITIGALSKSLRWSRYNALLMRYLRTGGAKTPQQRFYIRAVSAIIDNFYFVLEPPARQPDHSEVEDGAILEEEGPEEDDGLDITKDTPDATPPERITEVILTRLLPALGKFVAQNDDTDDNIRIPLALGTVKLAAVLPGDDSAVEIMRIITTVSQILRSKDQDTRDLARETMCKTAVFLGPDWFVRVLKELRSALQRGPQKHVAAVVTHAILALATNDGADRFANLDDAVEDAVQVSAEVVWGESGKDVVAEGFKTKMREVRGASSRGYDTFQLVSRLVSPSKIGTILAPLRDVMHASQAVKTMLHVDEALRRIALGLNANSRLGASELLSLCHSLITGNSGFSKPKRKSPVASQAPETFRVQTKRNIKQDIDFYALNAHKFVNFGLELFVTAFRRGRFEFEDVETLSRLGPMVSAVGNTLYSPTGSVLLLGLKATAAIARCPVPQVDPALPVFVTNIFKTIKNAGGSAESEISQTALKTLAVIIRDCKTSQISDTQLKYLLEVISPDLEEPDRQSAIFTVLRAVTSRHFVVSEIYDLMDRVSSIMVTSQSTHVQELCRGVLMQFLLDYPQGKGRLKTQLAFFARNLDYVFESGRISVMELLSAIFTKFSDELIKDYADLFFLALVAMLVNDDSEKCRLMAGALLKRLFGRLDESHQAKTMSVLTSWVTSREQNLSLAGASLAVYGLLADLPELPDSFKDSLLEVVRPILAESAEHLAEAESSESAFPPDLDYLLPHHALFAISKASKSCPAILAEISWPNVIAHLLFPHDWVRFDAARILAILFSSNGGSDVFDDDILLDIAKKSCILLKGFKANTGEFLVVDVKLADQLVKLLWTTAKTWAASDLVAAEGPEVDEDHDEADNEDPAKGRPLSWLMSRMSFLARHLIVNRPSAHQAAPISTPWTGPVMSILRFFAGVCDSLSTEQVKHFLIHILSPIYRILDDAGDLSSSEGNGSMDELRQLATEVRDFVQTKVGTTDFSQTWEGLRRKTNMKREGRREDRTRMAVSDPQKWAERKGKRVVQKKDSKKRKVMAFNEGRGQLRSVKRRG